MLKHGYFDSVVDYTLLPKFLSMVPFDVVVSHSPCCSLQKIADVCILANMVGISLVQSCSLLLLHCLPWHCHSCWQQQWFASPSMILAIVSFHQQSNAMQSYSCLTLWHIVANDAILIQFA